ncbi:hypothetical protein Tco_1334690 [Tanacetum coccineum]
MSCLLCYGTTRRVNLAHKGVPLESFSCSICSSETEDIHHLLFSCSLAQEVLKRVCRWWELEYQLWSSFSEWETWFFSIRLPVHIKSILEGVFYVSWWFIWGFRNRFIFEDIKPIVIVYICLYSSLQNFVHHSELFEQLQDICGTKAGDSSSSVPFAVKLGFVLMAESRSDIIYTGSGFHGTQMGFLDMLKFLVVETLKAARKAIETLQFDQYGSLVLHTALKLLVRYEEEYHKRFCFFKCLPFELPEDVVNKTLQIILELQFFKLSLFDLCCHNSSKTFQQPFISAIKSYSFRLFSSLPVSHLLWSSQSFGHQKGACPWSTENHFNSQYMKHWASQSFGT